ncbi:MAG: hypothetical protein H7256_08295 [Bdellovibrio sp.]|nr:hypothetical protein [Bdellovibrio sp.]
MSLFGCTQTKTTSTPAATGGSGGTGGGGTTTPASVNQQKLAVGESKAFAINSSNISKAWGGNYENNNGSDGQLGLGVSGGATYTTPQLLDSGTTYLSISSGETLTCGLTSSQKIKCWGLFLGDGSGLLGNAPVFINDGGSSTYIDISAGSYHGCAVKSSGVASCWGDGWEGKLGNLDGSGTQQDSPVVADVGTSYSRISAGRNHSCGITTAGLIRCWGTNSAGQLGDGTTTSPRVAPVSIDGSVTYSSISAGEDTTCAITTAGVLKCWGSNGSGQLGDGTATDRSSPTIIDAGTTYSKVSVGGTYSYHTCAVTTTGVLKCWGENGSGQLGNGTTTTSSSPVLVDSGVSYKTVSAYYSHSCGITTGGVLKCWGSNGSGELGIGNTTQQNSPTVVGSGY